MNKQDFLSLLEDPAVRGAVSASILQHWSQGGLSVKYCVLPGGKKPERMTNGAVGFDVYARAIVSTHDMDETDPRLRKTLFDFKNYPTDERLSGSVVERSKRGKGDKIVGRTLSWRLKPGEHVLVGVGVAFALPYELFQWTAPRSGLAAKQRIQIANAPGTIDSDYRGEAGLIVLNDGTTDFVMNHNMRIGQILFQPVIIPKFKKVKSLDELGTTDRGAGGFGSTGTSGTKPK